nr:RnfABCDGE type electron transport complex subunit B [Shuttleworthia satelles]
MTGIILATVVVAGAGVIVGFFLGFSAEKFAVEVDPKEAAVLDVLPGNNCGGCGYTGCAALAAAIAKGEAPVNQCPVGGEPVAAQVAEIMGVSADAAEREVAFVRCSGNCEKAEDQYEYQGLMDCVAASQLPGGGAKACSYGCLGLGTCVRACPFDAIHIVDGISFVDREKCKACGKCVAACPRDIIEMIPYDSSYAVSCISEDMGPKVGKVCKAGCIACHMCEKACEYDAVHVVNNIAHIDQSKCVGCGKCADKCPKKVILMQNVPLAEQNRAKRAEAAQA